MALKSLNNTPLFSPVNKKSISLPLSLSFLSTSSSPSLTLWSTSWNGVCVCVWFHPCVHVCVLQLLSSCDRVVWQTMSHSGQVVDGNSPTCDRACQSQRFPAFSSHLPPDVWPANTHNQCSGQRRTHTKTCLNHLLPWLVFLSLQASSCKT